MATPHTTPNDADGNIEPTSATAGNDNRRSLIDRSHWATYVLGATAFVTLLAIALILIGTNENRMPIAWAGLWLLAGAMLTWFITMGIIAFLVARDIFRYFHSRFAQRRQITGHEGNQVEST